MKEHVIHPFDLVSKAIGLKSGIIDENSEVYKTSNWDSFIHVDVVEQIEIHYEIEIPDEEVMEYGKMKKIMDVYENFIKK